MKLYLLLNFQSFYFTYYLLLSDPNIHHSQNNFTPLPSVHFIPIFSIISIFHLPQVFHQFRQEGQQDQLIAIEGMTDKKNLCKYDDYIEPKVLASSHHGYNHHSVLPEFKLDKIFPKNINIKLNQDSLEGVLGCSIKYAENGKIATEGVRNGPEGGKNGQAFKLFNSSENKFYHEYMSAKEHHNRTSLKRNKIAHIFNIRSINLIEKIRNDREKEDKQKLRAKRSSKEVRRPSPDQDSLKGLNLILVDRHSPDRGESRRLQKKNSMSSMVKQPENKSVLVIKDNNFENRLTDYLTNVKENCALHGLIAKEVESYPRGSLTFYVGRGNNGHLIKELLKKRWWWTAVDEKEKTKRAPNFIWTQLKDKTYYLKQERSKSSLSLRRSDSVSKVKEAPKVDLTTSCEMLNEIVDTRAHNHFECNEFLGNKKALYYNMKAYYDRQGRNVFDHLPVTFHVKRYDDQAWKQFVKYFQEDQKAHSGQGERLWIVKPGENSNRGNGITIYSDFQRMKEWVAGEISGDNNPKKTFIIQKYIDRPLLYHKRKFDIRCYMLLARLNGQTKGYWYEQGYIRTSCYEFQLGDTKNEFIHLTNDAIQVNCDKYGKYEDGNKLSYHNFQKYLDSSQKTLNFHDTILPQLKRIATDSIHATHHLLGKWNGLPTFEIFGLDFMIDEDFKPWLIQINTNPCLETSSTTLERVIPRMVDNAFRLTLDLLYPPPLIWQNSKKHCLPSRMAGNLFNLVFEQDSVVEVPLSQQVILEMGEIEEDNEVYEQTAEKEKQSLQE